MLDFMELRAFSLLGRGPNLHLVLHGLHFLLRHGYWKRTASDTTRRDAIDTLQQCKYNDKGAEQQKSRDKKLYAKHVGYHDATYTTSSTDINPKEEIPANFVCRQRRPLAHTANILNTSFKSRTFGIFFHLSSMLMSRSGKPGPDYSIYT